VELFISHLTQDVPRSTLQYTGKEIFSLTFCNPEEGYVVGPCHRADWRIGHFLHLHSGWSRFEYQANTDYLHTNYAHVSSFGTLQVGP
jgi:hypothetical protein